MAILFVRPVRETLTPCAGLNWMGTLSLSLSILLFDVLSAQIVVVDEARTLGDLNAEIRHMAAEQKQIPWLHFPSESHEHGRVKAESWNIYIIEIVY